MAENDLGDTPLIDHCYAKQNLEDGECADLPLVMQLSNLPIKDGLDSRHGGGGIETSHNDNCSETPQKRMKADFNNEAKSAKNIDDSDIESPLFKIQECLPLNKEKIEPREFKSNERSHFSDPSRCLKVAENKSCLKIQSTSHLLKCRLNVQHDEASIKSSSIESPRKSPKGKVLSNSKCPYSSKSKMNDPCKLKDNKLPLSYKLRDPSSSLKCIEINKQFLESAEPECVYDESGIKGSKSKSAEYPVKRKGNTCNEVLDPTKINPISESPMDIDRIALFVNPKYPDKNNSKIKHSNKLKDNHSQSSKNYDSSKFSEVDEGNKPPLVIPVSCLSTVDDLAIKHDGDSLETSRDDIFETPQKRIKIDFNDGPKIIKDIGDSDIESPLFEKQKCLPSNKTKKGQPSEFKLNELSHLDPRKSLEVSESKSLEIQYTSHPYKGRMNIEHDRAVMKTSSSDNSLKSPKKNSMDKIKHILSSGTKNPYLSKLKKDKLTKIKDKNLSLEICGSSSSLKGNESNKQPHQAWSTTPEYKFGSGYDGSEIKISKSRSSKSPVKRRNTLNEVRKSTKTNYVSEKLVNNEEIALFSNYKCPYKDKRKIKQSHKFENNELLESLKNNDSCKSSEVSKDKPPLVMQSSNLPTEDGLDIGHDGGGFETSYDNSCIDRPKKKQKTDSCDIAKNINTSCDFESSMNDETSILRHSKKDKMDESAELENDENSNAAISEPSRRQEFDILDEFECNDNEDKDSDGDSDISVEELDAMLEAYIDKKNCDDTLNAEEFEHEEKQKVILKVRGRNHFDVLPEGWIEVTHNSGMPIYLHKSSRVCSVSKPYFLGPGSTRKHEIPISAIPCLHYLKELEKEKNEVIEAGEITEQTENFPSAKIEVVKDTRKSGSLDYLTIREYCQKRFEFQTITVKRFKTWSGRRKHQKLLKQKQRPTLPDSTKLITCPLPPSSDKASGSGNHSKREFIMNPSGKSPVCILHEYVQHTLRVQPRYIFKELESASTPYGAVVMIGDMEYGSGYGSSKKQAKSDAARSALDVLIPKMKMFAPDGRSSEEQQDFEFFDQVRVEDPRVCELSVKAGQPYPYQILLECLKRNFGMGDTEIDFKMHNLKHRKNEFLMTVGKHSVSVVCKNKRDGKHRASQAILQLLHPHISCWGSLLRMYGKGSIKTLKEKKEAEQRITELQSQACANKPNNSILNKLKDEMLKYREKMKNKKPIGKLIPEQMNLSTSDSNLKNVEL